MIKSIKHKGLKLLFEKGDASKLPPTQITRIEDILSALNVAVAKEDMEMEPSHPGRILKNMYLDPLNLTVTKTAEGLGVSRKRLSALLNQRAGVSPEMAVRLSVAFSTTPQFWMGLQAQFDTWHAERSVSFDEIVHFHPKLSA